MCWQSLYGNPSSFWGLIEYNNNKKSCYLDLMYPKQEILKNITNCEHRGRRKKGTTVFLVCNLDFFFFFFVLFNFKLHRRSFDVDKLKVGARKILGSCGYVWSRVERFFLIHWISFKISKTVLCKIVLFKVLVATVKKLFLKKEKNSLSPFPSAIFSYDKISLQFLLSLRPYNYFSPLQT